MALLRRPTTYTIDTICGGHGEQHGKSDKTSNVEADSPNPSKSIRLKTQTPNRGELEHRTVVSNMIWARITTPRQGLINKACPIIIGGKGPTQKIKQGGSTKVQPTHMGGMEDVLFLVRVGTHSVCNNEV